MRPYYLFLLFVMISLCWAPAHAKKKTRKRKSTQLVQQISVINGQTALAYKLNEILSKTYNANISVYVKSMTHGDTLYSRNIYQPFTPASTLKILTAEAALLYLGPQYRFTTQLYTDAKKVTNGILQGNLYLVLNGDPTLTYADLGNLFSALSKQQIYGVAGNVYIDQTAFDQQFFGPGWVSRDKVACYGAPIGASIINQNCLPFRLLPANTPTKNLRTARRRNTCSLKLSADVNSLLTIDGCMTKNSTVTYVANDVPEYTRTMVKSLLQRSAISVYGYVTFRAAPQHLSLVSRHYSKPLSFLVKDMLKKSNNIIAGALFKKIGQLYSGKPGGWQNGTQAVTAILAKHVRLDPKGLRALDGSGLSRNNSTTPHQMMQVLDYAYHHHTRDDFVNSLPVAGMDGTLKHRMSHIARKVRAKTGYITGVVTLAGYATSKDLEPLAFVIMINYQKGGGWQYKMIEDNIATALTRYQRNNSPAAI